ncbi:hypothetical protein [Halobacterium noricense]|uniref:hypothetical protein n=1 Tax=Halobacterium noricense TaxID=223182 RepID=UPI001E39FB41|nr:hypothetical protein [Halobacterium noricense]UHH25933.1 hypothetical protein LT974_03100 [Halobacterium noricense]
MPDAVICWGGRASTGAADSERADGAPEGDERDGSTQCGTHRTAEASGPESSGDAHSDVVSE